MHAPLGDTIAHSTLLTPAGFAFLRGKEKSQLHTLPHPYPHPQPSVLRSALKITNASLPYIVCCLYQRLLAELRTLHSLPQGLEGEEKTGLPLMLMFIKASRLPAGSTRIPKRGSDSRETLEGFSREKQGRWLCQVWEGWEPREGLISRRREGLGRRASGSRPETEWPEAAVSADASRPWGHGPLSPSVR